TIASSSYSASGIAPEDHQAFDLMVAMSADFLQFEELGIAEQGNHGFDAWLRSEDTHEARELQTWLDECERIGTSDVLDTLIQMPGFVDRFGTGPLISYVFIEPYSALRNAARVEWYRAQKALVIGDTEVAIQSAIRQLGVARLYLNQPIAIHRLMGHAVLAMGLQLTRDIVYNGVTQEQHAILTAAVGSINLRDMQNVYQGEFLIAADTIVRTFPSNFTIRTISRGAQYHRVSSEFERMQAWSSKSVRERIESPYVESPEDWRYVSADILLPGVDALERSHDQIRVELEGIKLILAIEDARIRTGRLPDSLAEIVPEYLSAIPIDPFSPESSAYKYSLNETSHFGYNLYSVGHDGVDDGGVAPQGVPQYALAAGYEGTDYIFTRSE
ncbi:MAG: hypothetical protein F6K11_28300, partial [Leptolyngbya sp. SIO3F4]|nr:hypothetical protein [Leptolyngbya sp. SIO3F4]